VSGYIFNEQPTSSLKGKVSGLAYKLAHLVLADFHFHIWFAGYDGTIATIFKYQRSTVKQ